MELPNLLGKAYFRTQELNGTWGFHDSSNEDKLYDEELSTTDSRDREGELSEWLENEAIEKTRSGFLFHGHNGVSCIVGIPSIALISLRQSAPPSVGDGYKLPFETPCTYISRLEVKFQPRHKGVPDEILVVLRQLGYGSCNHNAFWGHGTQSTNAILCSPHCWIYWD